MIEPKGLRKNLSGFPKLREGDYRVIYQISHEEEIVFVRFI
jgi:mRNA-degrading endonuclease RelE of RelBE toxin-antitoxin system